MLLPLCGFYVCLSNARLSIAALNIYRDTLSTTLPAVVYLRNKNILLLVFIRRRANGNRRRYKEGDSGWQTRAHKYKCIFSSTYAHIPIYVSLSSCMLSKLLTNTRAKYGTHLNLPTECLLWIKWRVKCSFVSVEI